MNRRIVRSVLPALAASVMMTALVGCSSDSEAAQADTSKSSASATSASKGRPSTYLLNGDQGGSKFEGIGADEKRGVFYVSEVTGGEIHRGTANSAETTQWLAGDGTDGRWTARGITTDAEGNVYIAGGPNGLEHQDRPDLWVYSPEGDLLAALRAPGTDTFLNDVAIGADGAAYFTDSNDARLIRVAQQGGEWKATVFADASDQVERKEGFNWGGIVLSTNKRAFVVAQGTTGLLWRVDARTGATTQVQSGGADLTNADGLVLQGNQLQVVRNFTKKLATLQVSPDGSTATLRRQVDTDADRVLTTAKTLRGKILYVDSKFDEQTASGPYEVITDPVAR